MATGSALHQPVIAMVSVRPADMQYAFGVVSSSKLQTSGKLLLLESVVHSLEIVEFVIPFPGLVCLIVDPFLEALLLIVDCLDMSVNAASDSILQSYYEACRAMQRSPRWRH